MVGCRWGKGPLEGPEEDAVGALAWASARVAEEEGLLKEGLLKVKRMT
jgi:hypothetical protein